MGVGKVVFVTNTQTHEAGLSKANSQHQMLGAGCNRPVEPCRNAFFLGCSNSKKAGHVDMWTCGFILIKVKGSFKKLYEVKDIKLCM